LARKYLQSREYVALDGMTLQGPFPEDSITVEGGKQFVFVHKVVEGARRFLTFKRPGPRREPLKITTVKVPVGPAQDCVVKADGLAAGKGVFVCDNLAQALAGVERIMVKEEFGR